MLHGDPVGASGAADEAFVRGLYEQALGREAGPQEVSQWTGGVPSSRSGQEVAEGVLASAERLGALVDSFYELLLDRPADAAGRTRWQELLHTGGFELFTMADFLASAEFQQKYASDSAFVEALYDRLLGRPADGPSREAWGRDLAGGLSRRDVARRFLSGAEFGNRLLDAYYGGFLGRAPDPAGKAYWIGAMGLGVTPTQITTGFFTSSEYLERAAHAGTPAQSTLTEPPVLQSQGGVLDVTLRQSRGTATIAGRQVADVNLYNGQFPGPTLMVNAGDTLRVMLQNHLTQPSNLHLHGAHVSPTGNADNVFEKADPHGSRSYVFSIPANHPAGFNWYHPHYGSALGEQLYRGLAGMLVILRPDAKPLPPGVRERNLGLKYFELTADARVKYEATPEAALYTVNGQLNPTLTLRPGELQVWNLVNMGSDGYYEVELEGHALHVIAIDGSPYATPQRVERLFLAPGNRYSVVVQAGNAGTYRFRTVGFNDGALTWPARDLARVVVQGAPILSRDVQALFAVPGRDFEDLRGQPVATRRTLVVDKTGDASDPHARLTLNGKSFPDVPQMVAQLNTIEEWTIENRTAEYHPFSLHVNHIQVTAVNGKPFDAPYLQDIFAVPPLRNGVPGSFTFRVKYRDYTGLTMYHCHVIHHTDHGFAGLLMIQGPGDAPPPSSGGGSTPPPGGHDHGNHSH